MDNWLLNLNIIWIKTNVKIPYIRDSFNTVPNRYQNWKRIRIVIEFNLLRKVVNSIGLQDESSSYQQGDIEKKKFEKVFLSAAFFQ